MNKKLLLFLFIIIFVFGYTIYESVKLDKKLAKTNFSQTGTIIKSLPDGLKWYPLNKADGKVFDVNKVLTDGSNVIVHFWATWCAPCEVEFPELVELTKLLKEKTNLKFLFVAVNDDVAKVNKFLKKFEIQENTYLLVDNDNEYKRLGTYRMPESYLFGTDGKVLKKYTGQQPWTQKFIVDYLKSL